MPPPPPPPAHAPRKAPAPKAAIDDAFTEAVAYFRAKVPMSDAEFYALTEEARDAAFTVSNVAQLDMVAEVQRSLDAALSGGRPFGEWAAEIGPTLTDAWGDSVANPPWRLETIFRTNVQTAHQAGRYEQATDPDVLAVRPMWMFSAILDSRTSTICKHFDHTIRPADDAWWQAHHPPCHHACRSTVITLRDSQAKARGGVTEHPSPVPAAEGFGAPPGVKPWKPDPSDYPSDLWSAAQAKQAANDNE